jgi:GNAT superfamily N-acetyltransferase
MIATSLSLDEHAGHGCGEGTIISRQPSAVTVEWQAAAATVTRALYLSGAGCAGHIAGGNRSEATMDVRVLPVEFTDIAGEVRAHLAGLPSLIDSYLEDHILGSNHYRLLVAGQAAGFASIHGKQVITQFSLSAPYQTFGQAAFAQVRRMEEARSAYVPTCDEFYLSHALDDYRQLAKQAYFFQTAGGGSPDDVTDSYDIRPATSADLACLREETADFFDPLEDRIASGEVFVTIRGERTVGFGALIPSVLYHAVASIGMFTIPAFRGHGVGTATISLLIRECGRRGLRPVAGCWYFNHSSKRTLERAGMVSPTRLLKIHF